MHYVQGASKHFKLFSVFFFFVYFFRIGAFLMSVRILKQPIVTALSGTQCVRRSFFFRCHLNNTEITDKSL